MKGAARLVCESSKVRFLHSVQDRLFGADFSAWLKWCPDTKLAPQPFAKNAKRWGTQASRIDRCHEFTSCFDEGIILADEIESQASDAIIATIKAEIAASSPSRRQRIFEAVALAALGSIPWVGGVLSVAAAFKFDEAGVKKDDLRTQWLHEHQRRLDDLRTTLDSIFARFEGFGQEIEDRLESAEYLSLVRKAFREWDQADTDQKRQLIVHLVTHAAGTRICSDDILRLFLDWVELYHETHFAVIREIYKNPGPTRYDVWVAVYGEPVPRDDSAEADLFRMLIRDLSLGGVIRQPRETDAQGRFRKKTTAPRRTSRSTTMESAFDDTKQYVLTELGRQFVHYTMTELVKRIDAERTTEKD